MEEKVELLTGKMIKLYSNDLKEGKALIREQVKTFLKRFQKRKMKATDIRNFEMNVERQIKKLRKDLEAKAKKIETKADVVLASERSKTVTAKNLEECKDAAIPFDSYLVFAEYTEYQHRKDERERRRLREEKKIKMKEELDQQVAARKGKDHVEQKIEEDYAMHVLKSSEEYKRAKIEARKREAEKNRILKQERDAQLAALVKSRERVAARTRKEEEEIIQHAKEAIAKEEERRKAAIRSQVEYMNKVVEENEVNKRLKLERKKREQEEEKELQLAYTRKLEEQERMRTEMFEKMKIKSGNNQKMYLVATAEKTRQEEEDVQRALRFEEAKLLEDNKAALEEKKRRLVEKRRMNEALAEQVAEFKARGRHDEELQAKFAKIYQSDAQRAIEEERKRARQRKLDALAHKRELQAQIEEKRNRKPDTDYTSMTEHEKMINMPSIRKLMEDEEVVQAISNRL
eukprot:CAMPEP_0203753552 /NCGR_PEP_ID=MMETSP0098-20131031/7306_1 /ASSEMBLY_ACC=CAM_ASM_000208 /TAXON_ID=96639 /ORGANISM=" , Strain NY0313808BC1" /LENGTH=459 /DNA_ID=CAMNT_0050644199 /DNA_START=251 /DNA_END=1627 /DNA_ORIENTATION=-